MQKLFHKPKIFIGSARESLDVAREIQNQLQLSYDFEAVTWADELELTQSLFSSLCMAAHRYDFGVFILTADDETFFRKRHVQATRANVIFELGMFLGSLGPERTFMVVPRGSSAPEPITDLRGIMAASYDPELQNKAAAVAGACQRICDAIRREGLWMSHWFRSRFSDRDISQLVCDEKIEGSPFAAEGLLPYAEKEVFLAAQNHGFILNRNQNRFKQILSKLMDRGVRVRMLICDPEKQWAVKAWETLFQADSGYQAKLSSAMEELWKWIRDFKSLPFEAKKIPLVPLSVNFIDPKENDEALAVFTPNVFQRKPGPRACYLLTRREHPRIYDAYWQEYEYTFEIAKSILAAP